MAKQSDLRRFCKESEFLKKIGKTQYLPSCCPDLGLKSNILEKFVARFVKLLGPSSLYFILHLLRVDLCVVSSRVVVDACEVVVVSA